MWIDYIIVFLIFIQNFFILCNYSRITHGANESSQEIPLATIGPPQQFDPPPGRAPHPIPPHVPHEVGQQIF